MKDDSSKQICVFFLSEQEKIGVASIRKYILLIWCDYSYHINRYIQKISTASIQRAILIIPQEITTHAKQV